jgi:hypothetical protein
MINSNNSTGIIAQDIADLDLDTVTITGDPFSSSNTIIIDLSNITGDTTMISSGYSTTDTITISDGTDSYTSPTWDWMTTTPFENGFPDWRDFQEMCKEYPGLEKTFEHMKVFYKLCKDEWEAKKRGENG